MMLTFNPNIFLLIIFLINFVLIFLLAFTFNMISAILLTLFIFFNSILILFFFQLEFLPLLLLLVCIGALIVLVLFTLFVVNQINISEKKLINQLNYFFLFLILFFKAIYIFSTLKISSFSQIWLWNQIFEKESLIYLYLIDDINGFGPVLFLIGILLLIITIGISHLFKKNDD